MIIGIMNYMVLAGNGVGKTPIDNNLYTLMPVIILRTNEEDNTFFNEIRAHSMISVNRNRIYNGEVKYIKFIVMNSNKEKEIGIYSLVIYFFS